MFAIRPRWVCEAMDGWDQTRSQRGSTRGPGFSVIQNDGSCSDKKKKEFRDDNSTSWHLNFVGILYAKRASMTKRKQGWRIKMLMFEELRWLVSLMMSSSHCIPCVVASSQIQVWRAVSDPRSVAALDVVTWMKKCGGFTSMGWDVSHFPTFVFCCCCWCFWDIDVTTPSPSRRENVPYVFYPPFEGGDDFEFFFVLGPAVFLFLGGTPERFHGILDTIK